MRAIGTVRCLHCGERRWSPQVFVRKLRSMEPFDHTPQSEPRQPRFTAASVEDIRLAEKLRQQIQQRYLTKADRPSDPYWCIGAD